MNVLLLTTVRADTLGCTQQYGSARGALASSCTESTGGPLLALPFVTCLISPRYRFNLSDTIDLNMDMQIEIDLAENGKLQNVSGGRPGWIHRFGFETGQTMVDGLWQGPTAMTLDFITVTRRIKKLGFNTVRLPFSMTVCFQIEWFWVHERCCAVAWSRLLPCIPSGI